MDYSKILDYIENNNSDEYAEFLQNDEIIDELIKNNEIEIISKMVNYKNCLYDMNESSMTKLYNYLVEKIIIENKFKSEYEYNLIELNDVNDFLEYVSKKNKKLFSEYIINEKYENMSYVSFLYVNYDNLDVDYETASKIRCFLIDKLYEDKNYSEMKKIFDKTNNRCNYCGNIYSDHFVSKIIEEYEKIKKENEQLKLKLEYSDISELEKKFNEI